MNPTSVETFYIKPTNKYNHLLSSSIISLHAIDLISTPVPINNHRFFHRPKHVTPHQVVDTLKSSLAEALELYPPVAGNSLIEDFENFNRPLQELYVRMKKANHLSRWMHVEHHFWLK